MHEAIGCHMNLVVRERVQLQSMEVGLAAELFLPAAQTPCPAIVVCHGAAEFKENYIELCEFLARKNIGALALDMHGHGASDGMRFFVGMREWVANVRAALDFLSQDGRVDASRLGAFGLSSGGTAILETAVVDTRLKALVALDATVRNSLPAPLSAILKLLILIGRAKRFLTGSDLRVNLIKLGNGMPLVADKVTNDSLLANIAATAGLRAFPFPGGAESFFVNTIERVSQIKAASMVIWGEHDQIDPPQTGQLLFEALTCKKSLHIVQGNGHMGHLDKNRQKVFDLTAQWLSETLVANSEHVSPLEVIACRAG